MSERDPNEPPLFAPEWDDPDEEPPAKEAADELERRDDSDVEPPAEEAADELERLLAADDGRPPFPARAWRVADDGRRPPDHRWDLGDDDRAIPPPPPSDDVEDDDHGPQHFTAVLGAVLREPRLSRTEFDSRVVDEPDGFEARCSDEEDGPSFIAYVLAYNQAKAFWRRALEWHRDLTLNRVCVREPV